MSELKDYSILDIEAIDDERFKTESAPGKWVPESRVYLKSEADKVIAELKDDVEYWKKVAKKNMDDNVAMAKQRAEAFKRERHHKYKRCLGIAAVCFEKSYSTTLVKYDKESGLLRNFYDWWGKRWLELAEQFKEGK